MNKKLKYTSLVAAGAVTLGLVGGTLAWFTSYDVETNKFQTGETTDGDIDPNQKGIEINEYFESPSAMVPGDTVDKKVQVTNTATYDQFVRVNIQVAVGNDKYDVLSKQVPQKDENGQPVIGEDEKPVYDTVYYVEGYEDIELNFTNLTSTLGLDLTSQGKWYPITSSREVEGEGTKTVVDYFYYFGKIKADDKTLASGKDKDQNYTHQLLQSVTLVGKSDINYSAEPETDNQNKNYKNLQFDVVVTAESVQAKNGVYVDWCSDSLDFVYKDLEDGAWTPVTEEYIKHYNGPVRPTIRPTK